MQTFIFDLIAFFLKLRSFYLLKSWCVECVRVFVLLAKEHAYVFECCWIFITDLCTEFNLHRSLSIPFLFFFFVNLITLAALSNYSSASICYSPVFFCYFIALPNALKRFAKMTVTLNIFSFVLYLSTSANSHALLSVSFINYS